MNGGTIRGIVRADTDGAYYLRQDTEWVVEPTQDDPGFLGPVPGAVPVDPENPCPEGCGHRGPECVFSCYED